jgi:hypothetical protein
MLPQNSSEGRKCVKKFSETGLNSPMYLARVTTLTVTDMSYTCLTIETLTP